MLQDGLAVSKGAACVCGHVLRLSVGERLPWQRVINTEGRISGGGDVHRPFLQGQGRLLLPLLFGRF
jgi:alkylated DNA nucleotide flippase Atl1